MTTVGFQTEQVSPEGNSFYLSIARLLNMQPWELVFQIAEVLDLHPEEIGEFTVAEKIIDENEGWIREWSGEEMKVILLFFFFLNSIFRVEIEKLEI